MTEMTMKERVARAINEGLGQSWAYCNYSGNEWVQCRDMLDSAAELAIAAMSSPSHDRAMAEGGWREIASAPKDGSELLLSDHGDVYAGFWSAVENYRSWAEPDGNWYAEMDRGNEATAKPQRPQYWRSMRDLVPPTPTTKEETNK
jgi:hypothetical protein